MLNPFKVIERKIEGCRDWVKSRRTLKQIVDFLLPLGVNILYVELPQAKKIYGLTDFERERIQSWSFDLNKYKEELPKLKRLYGNDVTQEYILSVFDGGVVVKGVKRRVLLDFQSDYQHIINGRRITIGQPANYHNTIYTHGACTWRGTGVEDQETIASFLQKDINQAFPDSYKVVNSAIGRGSDLNDDFQVIKEQRYRKGDIVILGSHGIVMRIPKSYYEKIGMRYIETSSLFNRPHFIGEWFNDGVLHTNKRGNKVIADAIFKKLDADNWLHRVTMLGREKTRKVDFSEIDQGSLIKGERIYGDNPALLKFMDGLKGYKRGDAKSRCGCIVMNCNPFTLGHRYLIEHAASKVDYLYIFVVEENKSYFTFEDRLELVRLGTNDMGNVIVLPSGNFIISATTFPGYFYKDNLKEAKIDCSNDINVFAQYIAPCLNISVRFAGQEPLDPITNQYNEAMGEMLPKYGIQFDVIERKENEREVISASRVRRYFEAGKLAELKEIVPLSTYDYLRSRYSREHDD